MPGHVVSYEGRREAITVTEVVAYTLPIDVTITVTISPTSSRDGLNFNESALGVVLHVLCGERKVVAG
jgi:hypothetical protein